MNLVFAMRLLELNDWKTDAIWIYKNSWIDRVNHIWENEKIILTQVVEYYFFAGHYLSYRTCLGVYWKNIYSHRS